jgi:outer membrane protein assembly factor BamB
MQGDGNLVIYDADGVALWSSDSSLNHPGAHLAVQNDGNVVIYDADGTPLWATDTFVQ